MFGRVLRALRYVNDISIKELSELSGISVSYLSDIERNKRTKPSFEIFQKLAKAYNVPAFKIMEWCEHIEKMDDSLYSQQILMIEMLEFYLDKKRINNVRGNLESEVSGEKVLKR